MRVQDEVMGVGKGRGEMRGKGENMDFRYVTKLATKMHINCSQKFPKTTIIIKHKLNPKITTN